MRCPGCSAWPRTSFGTCGESQRRHRAALERLPRERVADFAGDVHERLDDERQMRAALRALRKLSRDDQDVLALRVWEELTYEQTALALGVPVGTVRSRLSRARARLRELTANPGHEWDEWIATEETS
jgi:RNA polymerase sigma-70 factor (ECF subfamily)